MYFVLSCIYGRSFTDDNESVFFVFFCSCFLNPATGFMWSFIAPVVVILTANIGFLFMAAVLMWRHKKRQTGAMSAKDIEAGC